MFLEEIKKAILTSKQLEVKSENFSKLNKFFGKEIDDFSFRVEDSIKLILDFGEKEYSINCVNSEKNLDNDFYYFIVDEALKKVNFPTNRKNYIFELGLRNSYELTFDFSIDVKHSYGIEGFEVKKLNKSEIYSIQKSQKSLVSLHFKDPEWNITEILGFVLEQNDVSLNMILKLKEDRDYFSNLENKIKLELFDVIHEISPKQKEFIIVGRKLINNWLNENCKLELRNLIGVNPYSQYFSMNENWLMPVDFLNSKCEYWFDSNDDSWLNKDLTSEELQKINSRLAKEFEELNEGP